MPFRNSEGFKCCNSCSTGTRNVCILEQKRRVTRLNLCAVALQVLPSSRGLQSQSHSTFHFSLAHAAFPYVLQTALKEEGGKKAASSTCCIRARKNSLLEGKVRQLNKREPRESAGSTALPSPLPAAHPAPGRAEPGWRAAPAPNNARPARAAAAPGGGRRQPATLS